MSVRASFRQLRMFLALCDHGSVTAAARACHVTQPTASMQLKDLADAVGLPLFERVRGRLHLTAAGTALAVHARAVERSWSDFEQVVDGMRGLTRGRLRVSFATTAKHFLPRLLTRFCAAHPDIDLEFQVHNRDGVLERLRANLDDLYVLSVPPRGMRLTMRPFLSNPLVVVAPAHHRLAARRRIALASLGEERWILRERGSGTRLTCDAFFARRRFSPDVRLEVGSNEALLEAVAGGLGIGVVSQHALDARSRGLRLSLPGVQGFPLPSTWYVLYPRGKAPSPIARAFLLQIAPGTAAASER
jgi:DNA-binding transcriptional LysR family regulator